MHIFYTYDYHIIYDLDVDNDEDGILMKIPIDANENEREIVVEDEIRNEEQHRIKHLHCEYCYSSSCTMK